MKKYIKQHSRKELDKITDKTYNHTKAKVLPLLEDEEALGIAGRAAEAELLIARGTLRTFGKEFPKVKEDLARLGFKNIEGELDPEVPIEDGLEFLHINAEGKRLVKSIYPKLLKRYFNAKGRHRAFFEPVLKKMSAGELNETIRELAGHSLPFEYHDEILAMAKEALGKKK
ncbi:MAG: hypothetical protein KAW41_02870 [Candidatus Diapherotrites archaeon]|nr:hypothetical protein [Candidatus Diapherotrites archaeon]